MKDESVVKLVLGICLIVGIFLSSIIYFNQKQTRIMADKGFCYQRVIMSGVNDSWTWEKCK